MDYSLDRKISAVAGNGEVVATAVTTANLVQVHEARYVALRVDCLYY